MSTDLTVDGYRVEPLGPRTWDAYADLAERHNGVWGGCWCTWFHAYPDPPERKALVTADPEPTAPKVRSTAPSAPARSGLLATRRS